MDRNTIIGLALIGLIVIGYGYFTRPSQEQIALMKHQRDSIAALHTDTISLKAKATDSTGTQNSSQSTSNTSSAPVVSDSSHTAAMNSRFGVFASSSKEDKNFAILENDLMRIKISAKGGKVMSVELKKYRTSDSLPLIIFSGDTNTFRLQFPTRDNAIINTDELYFTRNIPANKGAGSDTSVSMRLNAGEGKYVEFLYSLAPGSYMVGFTVNIVGLNDIIPNNSSYISVDWSMNLPKLEKSIANERLASTCYFKYTDDEVDYLSEGKDDKKSLPTKVKWIAFKQQFFTSVLISDNELDKPVSVETRTDKSSETIVKNMSASFSLPYGHKTNEGYPMRFYFGPNSYQTLKSYDLNLEKQIPLGWGIFGWVNRYLVIPTFNLLDSIHLGYGLIILILTLLIKLVLLPFTYRAYLSQAKMRVLKPELDEIHAKFPNDAMKAQQETMAIYKKAGVNPLGGCLPLLFQFPVLIAMFRFFPSSIELRQQSFLWAKDLSTYDSIYDFGFSVPFYGDHISLFTILMTVSTILYTMMNNQMMSGGNSAMQKQMKWMGYIMPFVFMGVLNNYSAGLSYYYFLANVTGFGQQYLFRYFVDEKAIHAKIQENKKKPQGSQKSKFQQRLEDMAKQRGYKLPK